MILICRFGSKIVSNSTGIILNDHVRLFSRSEKSPNYVQYKKRPLNWFTPVFIMEQETGYPIFMISAAGGGVNNFQVVTDIIFNFYLKNVFENHPTIAHVVNELRYVFAYHERSGLGNDMNITIIAKDPTIFAETALKKKNMVDALNDSDILFSQPYNFEIGNSSHFSYVSMMLLEHIPSPSSYTDARTKGEYRWISQFSFLNWLIV